MISTEQRRKIMEGKFPKIAGKGKCPLEPGDVVELSPRVSIRIDRIRIPRGGGWRVIYTRIDFRDLYLMPSGHRRDLDQAGRPKPMSQAEEHGMNSNPRDPVGAGAVIVGAEYQTVVRMPARLRQAERDQGEYEQHLQHLQAEVRALVTRAAKSGVDPVSVLAPVVREVKAQHENMGRAA